MRWRAQRRPVLDPWVPNLDSPQAEGLVAWGVVGNDPKIVIFDRAVGNKFNLTSAFGSGALGTLDSDPTGEWGTTFNVNGASSQHISATFTNYPVTAYPFSVCVWMKRLTTTFTYPFSGGDSASSSSHWWLEADGTNTQFRWREGGTANAAWGSLITNNAWHLLGGVVTSGDIKVSVDGGLSNGDTHSRSFPTGHDRVCVGSMSDTSPSFGTSQHAEFRIYKRELKASDWFHMWDPPTRYDLYYPIGRKTFFISAAAAGGLSIPIAAYHYNHNLKA